MNPIRKLKRFVHSGIFVLKTKRLPKAQKVNLGQKAIIQVSGFFSSSLGLGQAARKQAKLIEGIGYEVLQNDITSAVSPSLLGMNHDVEPAKNSSGQMANLTTPHPPKITILHLNPPETPKAIEANGCNLGDYKIGYWIYELEDIPRLWRHVSPLVHEVWSATQFSADALSKGLARPVEVMPLPIELWQPNIDIGMKYGLDTSNFIVLMAYDVNSSVARKNPYAAIEAFKRAFPQQRDVTLIVKVSRLDNWLPARNQLVEAIAGDTRIRLIEDILNENDMAGLVESADAILSMHRSEGFGLLLAEAMARGKAVVATGWSGNMDFMNEDVSHLVDYKIISVADQQKSYSGGQWADPSIDDAANKLRNCKNNKPARLDMGERAKKHVNFVLGDATLKKYSDRIEYLRSRN